MADSGWIAELEEADELGKSRLIQEAWMRTVSRPPTESEVARAEEHLADTADVANGITDLLWALVNTKEFLLNH